MTDEEQLYQFEISRDELHEQMGGGLPRGSIMLMEGGFGTGKSALSQRFTYGFLHHGHTVTVISTELTFKEYIDQMYSLDYPIASPVLDKKLLFIPVYPLLSDLKSRDDFIGALTRSDKLFDSDVIIIDTFSSLVKNSLDGETKAIEFLGFCKKLTGLNKSIILTVDGRELPENILVHFRSSSHIFVEFSIKQMGGSLARTLAIKRFGNAVQPMEDIIGFKVAPKVGIIIEITTVG